MSILNSGDLIGVAAPSLSLAGLPDIDKDYIENNFNNLGLNIKYAPNCRVQNVYGSSSVQERIDDINLLFLIKISKLCGVQKAVLIVISYLVKLIMIC